MLNYLMCVLEIYMNNALLPYKPLDMNPMPIPGKPHSLFSSKHQTHNSFPGMVLTYLDPIAGRCQLLGQVQAQYHKVHATNVSELVGCRLTYWLHLINRGHQRGYQPCYTQWWDTIRGTNLYSFIFWSSYRTCHSRP